MTSILELQELKPESAPAAALVSNWSSIGHLAVAQPITSE